MRIPSLHRLLRPIRESLLARLVAVFFLFSGIIVVLLGFFGYFALAGDVRASVGRQLEAFANLCETSLTRWVDEQARTVSYLSRLPGGEKAGGRASPRRAAGSLLLAAFHDLAALFSVVVGDHAEFAEILLLSPKGGTGRLLHR